MSRRTPVLPPRRSAALLLAAILALLLVSACTREGDRQPGGEPSPRQAQRDEPAWIEPLAQDLQRIDRATAGELGVLVHDLGDGGILGHNASRRWYLSSTVKVPVAIAVLQWIDEGRLHLQQTLELRESDFVDGAGSLVWQEPGGHFSIAELLERSIRDSDSTATDMLIRRIGEDELNRRVQDWVGDGFGPLTTILQVRYDAYGELHPGVAQLSNMDLIRLRNAAPGAPRLQALARRLGVAPSTLGHPSIEQAFAAYYERGMNSATLEAFGYLLQRLVAGELLSPAGTALLLGHMQQIGTGDTRVRAGLPPELAFAQKTGTQLERACNVGIVHPQRPAKAVIVAACAADFGALPVAETAMREVGAALARSGVLTD